MLLLYVLNNCEMQFVLTISSLKQFIFVRIVIVVTDTITTTIVIITIIITKLKSETCYYL